MSVQPIPIVLRERGRPTSADVEERHPLGRAAHRQQGRLFGIATQCAYRRETRPLWQQHDEMTDRAIRDIEAVATLAANHPDPSVRAWGLELIGHCAEYWRHDSLEDAVTLAHYDAFAEIHELTRQIVGFFERLLAAVRRGT